MTLTTPEYVRRQSLDIFFDTRRPFTMGRKNHTTSLCGLTHEMP